MLTVDVHLQSFAGFRPTPAATFNDGTPMAREQSGPAFGVSTTSSSGGSSSVRFEFPGCAPFAALQVLTSIFRMHHSALLSFSGMSCGNVASGPQDPLADKGPFVSTGFWTT